MLKLLQRREHRLLRRLERNQQHQLRVIRHPAYQRHQQRELSRLKATHQLEQPQFDLRHLL